MEIVFKAAFKSNNLATLKWFIINDKNLIENSVGFISIDFFKDFIIKNNHENLSEIISCKDIYELNYETTKNIFNYFKSTLSHKLIKNIAAADEASLAILGNLKLADKVKNKFSLSANTADEFDRIFSFERKKITNYNLSNTSSQLSLLGHLKVIAKNLVDNINNIPDDLDQESVYQLYDLVATSGLCWEANTRYTDITNLSPTAVTVGGPLLCTNNDPWPQPEGVYLEPFCQIPTDIIKLFTGYDGPSGIAQFYFNESITSRIIEPDEAKNTPNEILVSIKEFRGENTVCEITGINPPKVFFNKINDHILDDISKLIDEKDLLLFSTAALISEKSRMKSPYFMGSFHEIQYSPDVNYQCILSVSDNGDVNLGDGGSAQVFLKNKNKILGNWSCY
jgi:hypothetical protein